MQVRRAEIPQVAAAVRELNEADADAIPIAYIVVQKMHHTKFFPTDRNMDRSGNVLPGTPSKHIGFGWYGKQGHDAMISTPTTLPALPCVGSLDRQANANEHAMLLHGKCAD